MTERTTPTPAGALVSPMISRQFGARVSAIPDPHLGAAGTPNPSPGPESGKVTRTERPNDYGAVCERPICVEHWSAPRSLAHPSPPSASACWRAAVAPRRSHRPPATPPPNSTHAEAIAWVATLVRDLSSALRGLRPLVPGPGERVQARRMLAALATIRSVEAHVLRAGRTGTSFDLRASEARLRIANRQLRAAADALPAPMCATIGGAH